MKRVRVTGADVSEHFFVETFRMTSDNFRGVNRHRTVYENLEIAQSPLFRQPVEGVDQFLRAAHAESRNEQLAAFSPHVSMTSASSLVSVFSIPEWNALPYADSQMITSACGTGWGAF